MKELRLFLLSVGIPAVLLLVTGARLIYVEWLVDSRAKEIYSEERRAEKPREGDLGGPSSARPELDFGDDFDPGAEREDSAFEGGEPGDMMDDLERRDPPRGDGERDDFDPGAERRDRPAEGPGGHDHEPEPPAFFRIFSEKYGMDGTRELTILGCLAGLTLLSLVSGSWLLMRAARKARQEAFLQTDFVSNISHEFKTPLTTICLCAELAQDDGLDAARRKKVLASILSESERLKRLVLNALDFSRLEKRRYRYDLRTIDVAEIARESCAAFSPRFAEGRLQSPTGECAATADADAVRQILANLLDNAAKYAPEGAVEVQVASADGKVRLSVADHGPGLSSEALRHVFDRFWCEDNSVTRETGGSGLGLAIARGLARGMGGELTAATRKEGGAVFTLELKA